MGKLGSAPASWLNELAKGPIRTVWGDMMKTEFPAAGEDEVAARLKKKGVTDTFVIAGFLIAAPLLAERLAIAEYKLKNPSLEMVAPEILDYPEALLIASREWNLTEEQENEVMRLLRTDESMKVIYK